MTRIGWLCLVSLAACTVPRHVQDSLKKSEETLARAQSVYAQRCAPEPYAIAQSALDFSRLELQQGNVRRAGEHAEESYAAALDALEKAGPCGGADRDRDSIPDIADRCPDEPEDLDGVADEDGCRDLEPTGDEDGDGVANIDDACVDQPEDLDGDSDEDGCPETSEDSDGDGKIDAVDQCPEAAEDADGFEDTDGCPDLDNDQDGIPDLRDACALVPEDLDNWADSDGCPEADNDNDGLADAADACPNVQGPRSTNGCPAQDRDKDGVGDAQDRCPDEPETVNNYLDQDGCPDTAPSQVVVTQTQVEIKETIQFQTGSAAVLPASFRILDAVTQVLKDAPQMRLRIEGHTDAQGTDSTNLELSDQRAQSVRAYLEGQGVDPARLEAVGKGELEPLDTNRTPEGRALNRRVEFHIL